MESLRDSDYVTIYRYLNRAAVTLLTLIIIINNQDSVKCKKIVLLFFY